MTHGTTHALYDNQGPDHEEDFTDEVLDDSKTHTPEKPRHIEGELWLEKEDEELLTDKVPTPAPQPDPDLELERGLG